MSNEQSFEVRDFSDGEWYWIHKAVIQKYVQKVGAIGIAVYSFLASMADSDQKCFPSQRYIADALGYSRSYINKALKVLEMEGLIGIERKRRYHRVYYLLKLKCQLSVADAPEIPNPIEETQVSTMKNPDVNHSDNNDNNLTRNINDIDNKK